jgi:hypothetical protein
MADKDLTHQFDTVSQKAKAAAEKLKSAGAQTRQQLEADADAARSKASEEADRMKGKAADTKEKASSQWQEVQAKWREHVNNARRSIQRKKYQLDAKDAASDADMAEGFAIDALTFAGVVIDEAAAAALDAMYLRIAAKESAAKAGS